MSYDSVGKLIKIILLGYSIETDPNKFTVFTDTIDVDEDTLIRFSVNYNGYFLGFTKFYELHKASAVILVYSLSIFAAMDFDSSVFQEYEEINKIWEVASDDSTKDLYKATLMIIRQTATEAIASGIPRENVYSMYLVSMLDDVLAEV